MCKEVIRTYKDDNGKDWETVKEVCPRCNGHKANVSYGWSKWQNGACFECNGTGYIVKDKRVLTDKEKAQREVAKQRKIEKQQITEQKRVNKVQEELNNFIKENPVIYVCIDKNAYSRKEDLKANKFQFQNPYWVGFNIEGLESLTFITLESAKYFKGFDGWHYDFTDDVMEALDSKILEASIGRWIGQEKEKIQLKVTLDKVTGFSNDYGYTNIYIFKDAEGNILTWKTTKDMEWEEGQEIEIKATVKAHEEYKGEKQTSILRVKEA